MVTADVRTKPFRTPIGPLRATSFSEYRRGYLSRIDRVTRHLELPPYNKEHMGVLRASLFPTTCLKTARPQETVANVKPRKQPAPPVEAPPGFDPRPRSCSLPCGAGRPGELGISDGAREPHHEPTQDPAEILPSPRRRSPSSTATTREKQFAHAPYSTAAFSPAPRAPSRPGDQYQQCQAQRLKQVSMGKATEGYQTFLRLDPKDQRSPDNAHHRIFKCLSANGTGFLVPGARCFIVGTPHL